MSLKEQINNDIKTAMKEKNKATRDALRLITSAIKQVEVDQRVDLDDAEVIKIIAKMVKQRKDSIEQFLSGDRKDLAEAEEQEIKIIEVYLPQQLSDDKLEERVTTIVKSLNASSMKDMGKVMAIASKELDGIAEGSRISTIVKKLLS